MLKDLGCMIMWKKSAEILQDGAISVIRWGYFGHMHFDQTDSCKHLHILSFQNRAKLYVIGI